MVVPSAGSVHDAADSPLPAPAPPSPAAPAPAAPAEPETSNETPPAPAGGDGQRDARAGTESVLEAVAETDPEPEKEDRSEAEARSESEGEPEAEATTAADPEAVAAVGEPGINVDIDAPAKQSDAAPAAAEVGEEGDPAEELLPQSRRERRLAEEKLGTAVVPATSGNSPGATQTSGESVDPKEAGQVQPARMRGRLSAAVRGLLFLLVIAAMVVGLGTVLSSTADNHAGSSQTEVDRQSAWEATDALLEQATKLGTATNTPAVQELLAETVNDLSAQGAALGNGLPPMAATATATATAAAPATVEALVLGLRSSGERLLQHAVGADHAMGRVFAAAGTSQLLRSEDVAAAAGLGAAHSPALPARVSFPAPSAPECSSTLAPRPGASVDAALLAAADGEQKAVYAYQVATARLSEPQFQQGTLRLARHEMKLKSLNAELRVRCLPGTALVPGFALEAGFTTRPAAALASLEGELAVVYADLAALSTAPSTSTAATETTPATAASNTTSGDGAPSANTEQLREMSVAWLLDSAAAQSEWGGSIGALAGMAPGS